MIVFAFILTSLVGGLRGAELAVAKTILPQGKIQVKDSASILAQLFYVYFGMSAGRGCVGQRKRSSSVASDCTSFR